MGAIVAWTPVSVSQEVRTVTVGGREVRVRLAGGVPAAPGHPTVVFENGLGVTLEDWSAVQDSIAHFVPSVAYDRAGIGGSEPRPGDEPPTPGVLARELEDLLARLEVDPPWLFVGHSLGGRLVHRYATRFGREEVAGVVYVDPGAVTGPEELSRDLRACGLGAEGVADLNRQDSAFWAARSPGMALEHRMSRALGSQRVRSSVPEGVPVVVLEAGRPAGAPPGLEAPGLDWGCLYEAGRARIREIVQPWAAAASDGTYVYTTRSGHLIYRDEPGLVVWAIRRVLDSDASGSP